MSEMTTDTAIQVQGKVVQTVEEALARVRWNKRTGKLEQAVTLIDIGTAGAIEGYRQEWREVPIVDPDDEP